MSLRHALAAAATALLGACTTLAPTAPGAAASAGTTASNAAPPECTDWFARLDADVAREGVADAQEARIAGYPHLRTSRYTAALAADAALDQAAFVREVVPAMRALDREARAAEIGNLPDTALRSLGVTRRAALERTEDCAERMLKGIAPPRAAVRVPDNYSDLSRALGLYPLTRYPFTAGIVRHLAQTRDTFLRPLPPPNPQRSIVRYAVTGANPTDPSTGQSIASSSAALTRSPIAPSMQALLERHQPVFELEIAHEDDKPGALAWDETLRRPVVQTARPAVYRHVGQTRYQGRTLTQLVYTIWFGARTATGSLDLLAGPLDGLIWRVTIDADGGALLYDTIHPCGCYHYFFPTPRMKPIPAPPGEPEWAFVPQLLRQPARDERLVLRIATRTHYLQRVTMRPASEASRDALPLAVLAQNELRALPVIGAPQTSVGDDSRPRTHSAYGPDGLVPGTERGERFLFWPMGIASAGQMRQWGRHPTAFVGRRHFDDVDLIEKRFMFAAEE